MNHFLSVFSCTQASRDYKTPFICNMATLPSSVSLTLEKEHGRTRTTLEAPSQVSYSFHIPVSVSRGDSSASVNGGKYRVLVRCGEEEVEKKVFIPLPRRFMKEHSPFEVIFTDPERPWRLDFDQDCKIYFTGNTSTSFSVLSPGEEQPKRVECEDIVFARGIAVATEDEATVVYITGDHKLQKYRDGSLVAQLGKKGSELNQFSDPNGVRVYNDSVYVCDSGNCRIQVLSRDLRGRGTKVVGKGIISRNGYDCTVLFHPEDLDFDDMGNMYVADSKYHSVIVFTPCGEYKRTIPLVDSPFPVSLRIFRGIDEQAYFCVSARDEYCIMVYTLRGELIRKVEISYDENKTPGRGSLRLLTSGTRRSINYVAPKLCPTQPLGLAVDCDGFLYVACCNCNQLQVFE